MSPPSAASIFPSDSNTIRTVLRHCHLASPPRLKNRQVLMTSMVEENIEAAELLRLLAQAKEEARIAKAEAAEAVVEVSRLSAVNRKLEEELQRFKDGVELAQNHLQCQSEFLREVAANPLERRTLHVVDKDLTSGSSGESACLSSELEKTSSGNVVPPGPQPQQMVHSNLGMKRKGISEIESKSFKRRRP
ncbi:hypothetical protein NMY22_g14248 [Coprinellus aureogranulatus]|nr:hypothetical protein NMY22_g14248 [Coprinellus aureogranulatus]